MKILIFTTTLILSYSCTSEYRERLKLGEKIQEKIIELESITNPSIEKQLLLYKLKKDLIIQAKISGNEEKYFSEVSDGY